MKTFHLIGMILLLTAVANNLLAGLDTTVHHHIFGMNGTWLTVMGCLYGYGAGVFLYSRKEQLFKGDALFDKGERNV